MFFFDVNRKRASKIVKISLGRRTAFLYESVLGSDTWPLSQWSDRHFDYLNMH